jgi:hypothetical protein
LARSSLALKRKGKTVSVREVLNSGVPFGSAASILLKDVLYQRTMQAQGEDE